MKKKKKGRHVILSLVFLILGFMLAFSYHLTQNENNSTNITTSQWERDMGLRNQLVQLEEKNRDLQSELFAKQQKLVEIEKKLAEEEQAYFNLAEEAEKYRIFLGKVKVKGPGVVITLEDGQYDPYGDHINNYLVHEHHIFMVINELNVAGAAAVTVNGQRLSHNSYIVCNGPVIEIDGNQHPAPFEIAAIGDPEVLTAALNLPGGVRDILVNENIEFKMEKRNEIFVNPILGLED